MTSGNVSDEPIAYRDEDALERLARDRRPLPAPRPPDRDPDRRLGRARRGEPDAAAALARLRAGERRPARGSAPPLLACGAELKNTFCVAKGGRAWVGHHIGDLENYETLASFAEGIEHFQRLFAVEPELVVHDLHPEYLSTKYALEREGVEHLGVQHHHAHLAACLAEHGEDGPAVGAIFDGTGYGPDGTVWGGELLVGGCEGFERAGMLWPVRLPGGAAAIREPWRMACAWLAAASGEYRPGIPPALADSVDPARWDEVCELVRTGVASPLTTSAGRLFDAVAAICGAAGSRQLRGPGGGRARGARRPRRARRAPASAARRRGPCCSTRASWSPPFATSWRRGRRPRPSPRGSTTRWQPRPRAPSPPPPRSAAPGRSCSPAASSRTACCWSARWSA